MPLSTGDQLGPYEILAPLGAGGMGEVYRALDIKLNREVAVKVLPASLSNDAQYMARFEREAQTLAALNHPNIATVYGIEQGALVMELVEGANLRGPAPARRSDSHSSPDRRRTRSGARTGHRPSRPETRQHQADSFRRSKNSRLRSCQNNRRWCAIFAGREPDYLADAFAGHDAGGNDPRHGRLHVARAGARQACR